jgi:alkaline phosphatase
MAYYAAASGFLDTLLEAADSKSVFLAALMEKFIPVLPSYVIFPAMGMAAREETELLLNCLVATSGSVGGALFWYLLGALVGPRRVELLVERYGRWMLLSPQLYRRMVDAYERRPISITFVGQLVPTVRIFQALPAGVLRLPPAAFFAATAVGALCWIMPLAAAGHFLRGLGYSPVEAGTSLLVALVLAEALAFTIVRRQFATAR